MIDILNDIMNTAKDLINFQIFTWILTTITIVGTYLNSRQNKMGFLIWGVCNLAWLLIDFNRGIYAQAALYVVFIGFNVYGWYQWGKKSKEKNVNRDNEHKLLFCNGQFQGIISHNILDFDSLTPQEKLYKAYKVINNDKIRYKYRDVNRDIHNIIKNNNFILVKYKKGYEVQGKLKELIKKDPDGLYITQGNINAIINLLIPTNQKINKHNRKVRTYE
jgi:hypothetical protein